MTRFDALRKAARDPYAASVAVLAALGLAGLVGIVLATVGIADVDTVEAQLPYLVSGGLGGFGLVLVAVGLHAAQRRRLVAARRRADLDAVITAAAAALAAARNR